MGTDTYAFTRKGIDHRYKLHKLLGIYICCSCSKQSLGDLFVRSIGETNRTLITIFWTKGANWLNCYMDWTDISELLRELFNFKNCVISTILHRLSHLFSLSQMINIFQGYLMPMAQSGFMSNRNEETRSKEKGIRIWIDTRTI